jgi:NADH:ubiquinone oxidoreductase subunit 6 (subunit J)
MIDRKFLFASLLLIGALTVPVLTYFSVFIPSIDKPEIWFQRSGSVSVLLVIIAEYILGFIGIHVNAVGLIVKEQEEIIKKYKKIHTIAKYIGLVLAVIGTFIWGYGDLAWCELNA